MCCKLKKWEEVHLLWSFLLGVLSKDSESLVLSLMCDQVLIILRLEISLILLNLWMQEVQLLWSFLSNLLSDQGLDQKLY